MTKVLNWVCVTAFIMFDFMVPLNDCGKSCWPWICAHIYSIQPLNYVLVPLGFQSHGLLLLTAPFNLIYLWALKWGIKKQNVWVIENLSCQNLICILCSCIQNCMLTLWNIEIISSRYQAFRLSCMGKIWIRVKLAQNPWHQDYGAM